MIPSPGEICPTSDFFFNMSYKPHSSVIFLSEIDPVYNSDTKIVHPAGLQPTSPLRVLWDLYDEYDWDCN